MTDNLSLRICAGYATVFESDDPEFISNVLAMGYSRHPNDIEKDRIKGLEKELKSTEDTRDYYSRMNQESTQKVNSLEKENEELRDRLNSLEQKISAFTTTETEED